VAPALVVLAVAIALAVWIARRPAGVTGRPSVILVTLDTTRADHLTPYGYEHAETPTLDALRKDGVTYDRAYTPVPLTLPSHCSMMTGLRPSAHGILINGASALDPEAETLAEVLAREGYATGAVVAAFVLDHRYGLDQGFDEYDDDLSEGTDPGTFSYVERNAALVTDAALAWLRDHPDGPVFMWVHYFDPHAPYAPPGFYPADSERMAYDAEIGFMDAELGRLIDFVDDSGLGDDTIVIAVADHGEALWEHGEATHGLFTYEGTLRVPLIVRFPDRRHAGSRVPQPVSVIDVTPSVLAWTGLRAPPDLDGEELPLEARAADRVIYFENWHPQEFFGWSPMAGVVVGDHKLIDAPRRELYDLSRDPYEMENLYAGDDARAAALLRALEDARRGLEARAPLATPPIVMTEEIAARLEALGYIAPGRSGPDQVVRVDTRAKDPKDMIDVYRMVMIATTEIEGEEFPEAVETLAGALKEDPTNRRAILLLAGLVEEDAVRGSVMDVLEGALHEELPAEVVAQVHYAIGRGLALDRWLARAVDGFRRALAIDPDHVLARWGLVDALTRLGSPADVTVPHLERLVELAPGEMRFVVPLARAYDRLERRQDVIALYEATVEERPDEPIAKNNLAWFSAKYGLGLNEALALVDAAISAEPDAATYHHTRGYVLWKLSRRREAVAAFERALAIDPSLAECHYHLGVVRQELGESVKALASLGRAVELALTERPQWLRDAKRRAAELAGFQ